MVRLAQAAATRDPVAALAAICGADAVFIDSERRHFYAHDIHAVGVTPLAVVRPPTRKTAAAAIGCATAHGFAVFARGGGMSYTDGFLPTTTDRLHRAIMDNATQNAAVSAQAHLVVATSFFAVGPNALLYEPVFYWEDRLSPYQLAKTTAAARYADNPAARALVETMSDDMVEAMYTNGAAHLQIGRRYPYARERDLTLLRAVKSAVDPHNLLNPGVLGL